MIEIYVVLAGAFGAFLTKLIDWLFNKKSMKEDARSKEIDNEIKMSNQYKEMLDDIEPRYQKRLIEFEERVAANEKLQQSKEKLLREEINLLRKENRQLRRVIDEKNKELELKNKRILELESK